MSSLIVHSSFLALWITKQASLDQSVQNTVTHDGLHGVLQHGHSVGGKGVAGGEETLHSPSMSMLCAPALWQGTQTLLIPTLIGDMLDRKPSPLPVVSCHTI